MPQTVSIQISGKVQGVFYRKSAREKAVELGLTGEVSNQDDGSVLIIATGEPEQISQLTDWCKKGPARAIVDSVLTAPLPLRDFDGFNIVR